MDKYSGQQRLSVALLFGGVSHEHDISQKSAEQVLRVLPEDRYAVTPILIDRSGNWIMNDRSGREGISRRVFPVIGGLAVVTGGGDLVLKVDIDVVFPLLHGSQGEDGAVQGLLEMMRLPYVGSGVLASALCWDKDYTKRLLRSVDLPTVPYLAVQARGDYPKGIELEYIGLPAFVKPARGGSSLGITRITAWSELEGAIRHAREYDDKVLLEPSVTGREISCTVLESGPGRHITVSRPIEALLGDHTWYSYEAKYFDPDCKVIEPLDLDDVTVDALQRASLAAFDVLGCASLARVDFFLRPDNSFLISEINTMPGFTSESIFPVSWAHAGLDYASLLDRLIDCAIKIGPR